jgi:hypothetical protein
MNLPDHFSGPIEVTDPRGTGEFGELAQLLGEQGSLTLVYAPSTTTVHSAAPVGLLTPVPTILSAEPASSRRMFTRGDVVAYSGATLMGGAVLSGLISALLAVPMLVPLLSGGTALVGMLAAIGGAALDNRERGC